MMTVGTKRMIHCYQNWRGTRAFYLIRAQGRWKREGDGMKLKKNMRLFVLFVEGGMGSSWHADHFDHPQASHFTESKNQFVRVWSSLLVPSSKYEVHSYFLFVTALTLANLSTIKLPKSWEGTKTRLQHYATICMLIISLNSETLLVQLCILLRKKFIG